jgi:hypothetical protein
MHSFRGVRYQILSYDSVTNTLTFNAKLIFWAYLIIKFLQKSLYNWSVPITDCNYW